HGGSYIRTGNGGLPSARTRRRLLPDDLDGSGAAAARDPARRDGEAPRSGPVARLILRDVGRRRWDVHTPGAGHAGSPNSVVPTSTGREGAMSGDGTQQIKKALGNLALAADQSVKQHSPKLSLPQFEGLDEVTAFLVTYV